MADDAREEFRGRSKNDLIREVLTLRRLLSDQMAAAPGVGEEVTVEGCVSVTTGEPFVLMRAGEAAWQFSGQKAREHAVATLERAIEADRDAALVAYLREHEFDEAQISVLIGEMREHRTVFIEGRESEAT